MVYCTFKLGSCLFNSFLNEQFLHSLKFTQTELRTFISEHIMYLLLVSLTESPHQAFSQLRHALQTSHLLSPFGHRVAFISIVQWCIINGWSVLLQLLFAQRCHFSVISLISAKNELLFCSVEKKEDVQVTPKVLSKSIYFWLQIVPN